MPVLADIFSAGNTIKRRMKDFVADPGAFLETEVNYRNQKAGEFNTLQDLATQGDINKMRGLPVTQEQQAAELRLRDIVAGAYNPVGMTAYHASPYLFSRFDPRKMGSGEGAQAYGVGAGYTAEARPVASSYLPATSEEIAQKINVLEPELDKFRTYLRVAKKTNSPDVKVLSEKVNELKTQIDQTKKSAGYLYKGDIPDEIIPKFLDYDAPLKDQSPEVQALAKSLGMDLEDLGGDLLGKVGKTVKGTLQMQGAGIKGIRYLDQGSRGKGKGTSNFIPFSPDDFKIQEINDEPLEAWLKSGRLKVDQPQLTEQDFVKLAESGQIRMAKNKEQELNDLLTGKAKFAEVLMTTAKPEIKELVNQLKGQGYQLTTKRQGPDTMTYIYKNEEDVRPIFEAKNPAEYGKAYGYSDADIARFYMERGLGHQKYLKDTEMASPELDPLMQFLGQK